MQYHYENIPIRSSHLNNIYVTAMGFVWQFRLLLQTVLTCSFQNLIYLVYLTEWQTLKSKSLFWNHSSSQTMQGLEFAGVLLALFPHSLLLFTIGHCSSNSFQEFTEFEHMLVTDTHRLNSCNKLSLDSLKTLFLHRTYPCTNISQLVHSEGAGITICSNSIISDQFYNVHSCPFR